MKQYEFRHYLFLEAFVHRSHLGTDDVRGHISEQNFAPNGGCYFYCHQVSFISQTMTLKSSAEITQEDPKFF